MESNSDNEIIILKTLIEKLAEVEHDQWIHYSKGVSQQIQNARSLEELQKTIEEKWFPKWKNYSLLPETDKEKDRIWARKVVQLITNHKNIIEIILSNKDKYTNQPSNQDIK